MMKYVLVVAVLLLGACSLATADRSSQVATGSANVEQRIIDALDGFQGDVSIYARNLDTGREFGLRADERVRTASTIKLPIMVEAFRQVEDGILSWDQALVVRDDNKVSGSGILKEFSAGSTIDLRTAVVLMTVVSDNTATNLVLDLVSADQVNDRMTALGLSDTYLMRRVGGVEAGGLSRALLEDERNMAYGLGSSSPRDMVRLLEMIDDGEVVSPSASADMIAILGRQQYKNAIGRMVPGEIRVASKSGTLERLRSDVGIVYTPGGRIAIAITVDNIDRIAYGEDNPGLLMIWTLSQILQEALAS